MSPWEDPCISWWADAEEEALGLTSSFTCAHVWTYTYASKHMFMHTHTLTLAIHIAQPVAHLTP